MRHVRWVCRGIGRLVVIVVCMALGITNYGLLGLLVAAALMMRCSGAKRSC
jgi:hypothetical protein